jgi:hypothetical protein
MTKEGDDDQPKDDQIGEGSGEEAAAQEGDDQRLER